MCALSNFLFMWWEIVFCLSLPETSMKRWADAWDCSWDRRMLTNSFQVLRQCWACFMVFYIQYMTRNLHKPLSLSETWEWELKNFHSSIRCRRFSVSGHTHQTLFSLCSLFVISSFNGHCFDVAGAHYCLHHVLMSAVYWCRNEENKNNWSKLHQREKHQKSLFTSCRLVQVFLSIGNVVWLCWVGDS